MRTPEYSVTGMTCAHCESAVSAEVSRVAGVAEVSVSARDGRLSVTGVEGIDPSAVIEAVAEAGYQAEPVGASGLDR